MVSKKILSSIAALAGGVVLGFSSMAFAGGEFAPAPAPIAGCDDGNPGFYITGRLGWGDNHWNHGDNIIYGPFSSYYYNNNLKYDFIRYNNTDHDGFAGGVDIGYAFNKFLAVEIGYMYLPDAKYNSRTLKAYTNNGGQSYNFVTNSTFQNKVRNHAFDLVGRISIELPGVENVGLFAKAGVSYLRSSRSDDCYNGNFCCDLGYNYNYSHTKLFDVNNTNLVYGFGAYWNFTSNLTLDIQFMRYHGNGDLVEHNGRCNNFTTGISSDYQPFMDSYTVGLTYHIDETGGLFNT